MSFEELYERMNEKVYWDMIDAMAVTDDWERAGMIDTDGNLLDFVIPGTDSAGGKGAGRKMFHEDLASTWGEVSNVWDAGHIRINLYMGILELGKAPTTEQLIRLKEYLDMRRGSLSLMLTGSETVQVDLRRETPTVWIINMIKKYYEDGERPVFPERYI